MSSPNNRIVKAQSTVMGGLELPREVAQGRA